MARSTAQAAADAFARRVAVSPHLGADDLRQQLADALPGADEVTIEVVRSDSIVTAEISFEWDPPGPRLLPVTVGVRGVAPIVQPP